MKCSKHDAFVNLKLFSNGTFTGATLSNFLLNGAAGTLIVSLGLVQVAAGMSSLQSGLLTLGYLIAILATIRVGEKLLQRFGPKKPMLWGSIITGVGILMCSMTFLLIDQYIVFSVIGFTLFGIGLGFYATPSTDAALSNVPDAQVGAASGIYKMASSLGNAIGVAISAALYVAGQAMDPATHPVLGTVHRPPGQRGTALRRGHRLALQRADGGHRDCRDHPHGSVRAQGPGAGGRAEGAARRRSPGVRQLSTLRESFPVAVPCFGGGPQPPADFGLGTLAFPAKGCPKPAAMTSAVQTRGPGREPDTG